jgi:L-lactate dehydrogenase complex protein LldG
MTSRDRIMAKVRAGLAAGAPAGVGDVEAERQASVATRIAAKARNLVPARTAGKSPDELVAIMRHWLGQAGADVIEIAAPGDVPAAVVGYLADQRLPPRVRMGADRRLAVIPWERAAGLHLSRGAAAPSDVASVTYAHAAVAETGTLVVRSGPENPVTLSFLPQINIVLVARGDVVGPLEDALVRLRARLEPAAGMPRTLNLISGPSRSADIGGIPVLGAHGPRRLCVVVLG